MKKIIRLQVLPVAMLVCGLVLVACSVQIQPKSEVQLDVPVLVLDTSSKTASWNAVGNARSVNGYTIKIGEIETVVSSTSFLLANLAEGEYGISVKTNGYETAMCIYVESPYCAAETYTADYAGQLATPMNLQISGTTLNWNIVPDALDYTIDIDGVTYISATNSYSLTALVTPNVYILKVRANSDGIVYHNSNFSATIEYIISTQLSVPTGLHVNSKNLTWSAVVNASGYMVQVNDEMPVNIESSSFSITSLEVGEYLFKVKVVGNGTTYIDSDWSSEISYVKREYTQGLQFMLINNDTEYSVGKGTTTDSDIVIPAVYEGLPVTTIGYAAFYNFFAFTSITIPDSVTTIGESAFNGCVSLTDITIPNSVTHIGAFAFLFCQKMTGITIPSSVTHMGEWALATVSHATTYTEFTSKPNDWNASWNHSNHHVFWGCTLSSDKTFVVSFTKTSTSIEIGNHVAIAAPYREGFAFGGWAASEIDVANGVASYTAANVNSAPNGTTLYAIWTPKQ